MRRLVCALLPALLVATAARAEPTTAVLVTRHVSTAEDKALLLAARVAEALSAQGIEVLGPNEVVRRLKEKNQSSFACESDRACALDLSHSLACPVAVIIQIGMLHELAFVHVEAAEVSGARTIAEVDLQAPRAELDAAAMELVGQFAKKLSLALPAKATPAPPPPPPPVPPAAVEPKKVEGKAAFPTRTLGFVLDGAGAAIIFGGVMAGVLAQASYDDAKKKVTDPKASLQDFLDAKANTRKRAIAADVLYGVGAAALAAGLCLTLFGTSGSEAPPASVTAAPMPGGGAVVLAGGF